ncbi:hypothetical protein ABB37_03019 [Leptomonas pyrrhocoris]|uniref:Uncharacterized protein n=1 Tax=Leptomonas pyrrhocoris TaxID=157538 RepID=A0A0M9G6F2_LEPPY|nr:hypothetical protein ABB37_03019 [Leptomonas pyrrhocoris]KPA83373.1 hypothetical protein ABB37_03019 [Leptomonas pyrrhocoris]|eukprot:XP_015661812.1 hypothetical protein ABB37_03019 [Leptomonas pyrrhocoris]
MFATFSGWVSSAADAVNSLSDQGLDAVRQTGLIDALQNTTLQVSSTAPTSPDQQLAVKDFMTPPATWTGSSDEWKWCIEAALDDRNTCAITPTTLKSDDNLWQEIHSLITRLKKNAVATAAPSTPEAGASTTEPVAVEPLDNLKGTYTPSADLVAFIQAHTSIYEVRSYVVPLFTSDEDYWLNLGWRLTLYRLCTNAGDLLTVMRTLSKLPARLYDIACAEKRAAEEVAETNRAAAAGREAARANNNGDEDADYEEEEVEETAYAGRPHLTDNSAYWSERRKQYEAAQEKFAWLRETQDRIKKEMELARGNVKLLESLLQRQEASSAVGVSLRDSCNYHKVKLSRLIADVCAAPEDNTKGTVLDAASGSLFHELFQCNEAVKNVLHAYAGLSQKGGSGGSPKAQAPPLRSPTPTSPSREVATANDAPASLSLGTKTRTSASPKTQSVASSSAVELSAAGSASPVLASAQRNSRDNDDDEGSFEAKLPWSMDE